MNDKLIAFIKDRTSEEKSTEAINSIGNEIFQLEKDRHTYLVLASLDRVKAIMESSKKSKKTNSYNHLKVIFTSSYTVANGSSVSVFYFDSRSGMDILPANNTSLYEINTLLTNMDICNPKFTGLLKDKNSFPITVDLSNEPEKLLKLYLSKETLSEIDYISLDKDLAQNSSTAKVKFKV